MNTCPFTTAAVRTLQVQQLGLRPYREVWEQQKKIQSELIAGAAHDTLILCRHYPVVTLGRSSHPENVLADEAQLARLGVERVEIERGGDVTFHGPGQIVGYPLLNLNFKKRDVDWYMRSLEEVLLRTLADYGIQGVRVKGKTGVWVETCEGAAKKIASIGVRISRWCTLHGFALNVEPDEPGFLLINPCGFKSSDMTSVAELLSAEPGDSAARERQAQMGALEGLLIHYFRAVFGYPTASY